MGLDLAGLPLLSAADGGPDAASTLLFWAFMAALRAAAMPCLSRDSCDPARGWTWLLAAGACCGGGCATGSGCGGSRAACAAGRS